MNTELRKQRERVRNITLEARTGLLHPIQCFGVPACLMKCIDDVQVWPLRIRHVRETIDVELVIIDSVIPALQPCVTRSHETERVARAGRLRIRIKDFLKELDRVIVLALGVQTTRDLKHRVRDGRALGILIDDRLIMNSCPGEVAVELVDRRT